MFKPLFDLFKQIGIKLRLSALGIRKKLIIFRRKHKADEIFYIGGSDVLPPPLSPEDEKVLLEQLVKGSKDAKTILIERNLRLVVYIAKKFENAGINVEDLISIGAIGLIKAVNTFNLDKNIKLATYASRCIENEILMYLRRNSRTKSEVSFDEPLNTDWDGNELLLSDILGTESDIVYNHIEEEVNKNLLVYALKKLTNREKQIMEMRFGLVNGKEMTQKEVADRMGISQSYISRLEKKIIGRLRKEIKKLG
ncbi:MAG TPA: RNA polymerase sporulation sigma factor SigE [Clostridiales bacterium]|nr:RNA polymerase sporulation sigma factor SigE [Clostridiales bacterium]